MGVARCGDRELSIGLEASAISNLIDADDDEGKTWRQRVVDFWRPLQSQTSSMLLMMEARCGDRELSIDPEASAISNLIDADDDGGKMWRQRVVDRSGGLCNLKPHRC